MKRASLIALTMLALCPNRCSVARADCIARSHVGTVEARGTTWLSRIACDRVAPGAQATLPFAYALPPGSRVVDGTEGLVLSHGAPIALSVERTGGAQTKDVLIFTPARRRGDRLVLTPPLLAQESPQLVGIDDIELVFTPDPKLRAERSRGGTLLLGEPRPDVPDLEVAGLRREGVRGDVWVVRASSRVRALPGLEGTLETRAAHFRGTYIVLAIVTVIGAIVLFRVHRRTMSVVELEEAEALIRADLDR